MNVLKPRVIHHLLDGNIEGKEVVVSSKAFKDIKDIYLNSEGIDDDTKMYTVYSYFNGDQNNPLNLNYGMSVLHPVYVNDECNMTRGHFHNDENYPEIYVGLSGEGLLMMADTSGQEIIEEVFAGSVHYIDGKFSHRLINTGDVDLKVQAIWSPCAGHDYEKIKKFDYKYRVFKRNGKLEFEEK